MKCPECGRWNRNSLPRCVNCGAPLNIDDAGRMEWRENLKDAGRGNVYIRVDEYGLENNEPDRRDVLAQEMADLKDRKNKGEVRQEQIRQRRMQRQADDAGISLTADTQKAENSSPVQNTGNTGHTENADHLRDIASMTRKQKRIAEQQRAEVREKLRQHKAEEVRHRIRIIDDNGGWSEQNSFDYEQSRMSQQFYSAQPDTTVIIDNLKPRREKYLGRLRRLLLICLALSILGIGGFYGYRFLKDRSSTLQSNQDAIVTASMRDGLAAHTVLIPGENGTQIYIRELHASYLVTEGFATVEVADHTWYDNYEGTLEDSMEVTMTPFVKTASGKQTPLDPIMYTITIPTSPITLDSPDSLRTEVATTMSTIRITVRPGSTVTVNGLDYSDTVNSETGEMSYNATVQPIGNNEYTFVVRSQYCRDNSLTVTLYREYQEIPLDLAVGTYGTTNASKMKVTATTLPGAYVEVLSPYADLDITGLDETGRFTFNALFNEIGDNTIIIESSYEGKKTSHVEHTVYYLPPASEYTVKAWPLTADGYSELLSNLSVRAERKQIYVVTGVVQYSVSDKPQMVVINTGDDGKSQPVLVENKTSTTWQVGTYYRIYGDVYSTYNGMPWLIGRFTYRN